MFRKPRGKGKTLPASPSVFALRDASGVCAVLQTHLHSCEKHGIVDINAVLRRHLMVRVPNDDHQRFLPHSRARSPRSRAQPRPQLRRAWGGDGGGVHVGMSISPLQPRREAAGKPRAATPQELVSNVGPSRLAASPSELAQMGWARPSTSDTPSRHLQHLRRLGLYTVAGHRLHHQATLPHSAGPKTRSSRFACDEPLAYRPWSGSESGSPTSPSLPSLGSPSAGVPRKAKHWN